LYIKKTFFERKRFFYIRSKLTSHSAKSPEYFGPELNVEGDDVTVCLNSLSFHSARRLPTWRSIRDSNQNGLPQSRTLSQRDAKTPPQKHQRILSKKYPYPSLLSLFSKNTILTTSLVYIKKMVAKFFFFFTFRVSLQSS